MTASPRSLVFTIYGDYLRYCGEGEAPLGALSQILAQFGIEAGTARVVMNRLKKEGWFDTRRQGREVSYVLTEKGWDLLNTGRDRIFTRWESEWNREWSMVLIRFDDTSRASREDTRRALVWNGFGQLNSTTWLTPHDILGRAEKALSHLPSVQCDFFRSQTRSLSEDRELAHRCWDLSEVQRDYQQFTDDFESTPEITGMAALIKRIELTDAYRHFPFRDPDLPRELLPEGWTGTRAHTVFTHTHASLKTSAEDVIAELTGLPVVRN